MANQQTDDDDGDDDMMDLPVGFINWTELAMLAWTAVRIVKLFKLQHSVRAEVIELKSELEKFLQPQIRFYIGNELQRRIVMKDSEKQTATIAVTDAKGFPVDQPVFDAPPAYTVDDPTVASLKPSDDGLSCDVIALAPGATKLNVAASAAGKDFAGSVDVLVTSGDAAAISISLGAAVPQ